VDARIIAATTQDLEKKSKIAVSGRICLIA
jgi:hypothetical protein